MPLEQWEIDLRNQLSGVPEPEGTGTEPTEKQADPEVPPAPRPSVDKPAPAESVGSTLTFIITLVFLLCVTLYVYDDKTGGSIRKQFMSFFRSSDASKAEKQAPRPETKPSDKQAEAEASKEIDKLRAELTAKIDALGTKLGTTNDKVKAMGLLLNENFNILAQKINDSFIFLNRDWTLDRSPRYLELHPDDVEYLKKYVRENQ